MRKLFIVIMVTGLFMGLVAGPSAADPPAVVAEGEVIFEDVNPCDAPNTHVITRAFTTTLHEHQNNFVLMIDNVVSTDSGFEGRGHETTVFNNNNQLTTFNFTLTNPDTGQKMQVKAHFTFDVGTGEFVVERFRLKCVRD